MDGSSSGIYFAPATSQPDYYVLYLQGGGWYAATQHALSLSPSPPLSRSSDTAALPWRRCNDKPSCTSRCGKRTGGKCSGALASSSVWQETVSTAGLFSTSAEKTALPGAHKAYLRYCTGDAHMGNRDASEETFGFNFHGSRTVAAALSLLVKEHGLGSKPGQVTLSLSRARSLSLSRARSLSRQGL